MMMGKRQTYGFLLVLFFYLTLFPGANAGEDIVYYGDNNYPPYAYVDRAGNQTGFEIELMNELSRLMEFDLEIKLKDWRNAVDVMRSERKNAVSSMLHTPEREKYVDFSIPYVKISYAIFTRKDASISSLNELKDSVLIVQESDVMHDLVIEEGISFRLILAKNQKEALRMLASGRGAAALCAKMQGYYYISEYNLSNLESHELSVQPFDYCFVSPKGNEDIIAEIDEGLNILKQSGRFDELYEKWFGIYEENALNTFLNRWGFWILLALLLTGGIIMVWIYTLRNTVSKKTRELRDELEHRKLIEDQLRVEKDRAEESEKLKSAFLANMSHEIRTPMNGIMGYAELLTDENLTTENRKRFTDTIIKNSHYLLKIITDLINISKIESGQVEVNHSEFSPVELVKDLYHTYSRITSENVELEYFIKPQDFKGFVVTDYQKLRDIIDNLLSNAVKFTSEGQITIRFSVQRRYVRFTIEDTGTGIPEEIHDRIFENFWQLNPSDATLGGTGLGLSIVKGFTKALKGSISVNSEPGKGSTFIVTLPAEIRDHSWNKSGFMDESSEYDWHNKKILIAEDEDSNFEFMQEVLKSTRAQIYRAEKGIQAVELARLHKDINLILMDVKLPGMDGYEAIKQIRSFNPDVPVIVQTAFTHSGALDKAMSSGANDFYTKPFKPKGFVQFLARFIEKQ